MAATETIKWIAVPVGIDKSTNPFNLKLSVLVSPALSGGTSGTLADFSDFANWVATLSSTPLRWEATVTNQGFTRTADGGALDTSGLNATLWTELFPPSTVYGPPSPVQDQFRNIAIASYPAGQISSFVTGQYGSYSPTDVPTLGTLKGVYGPIADVLVGVTAQERFARLAAERAANSNGGKRPHANNFHGASMADAFAAQAFYHSAAAGEPPTPGVEDIDFHKALTFVGQHGVLQRTLGLVFDGLLLNSDVLDVSDTANTSDFYISVALVNGQGQAFPLDATAVSPRTQCQIDVPNNILEAFSSTGNVTGGMLTVGDATSYNAHVIDFDGAGLRASSFATQLHLAEAPASISEDYISAALPLDLATPMPPPMVRSTGLTLTEVNRGVNFASLLDRAFLLFDAVQNSNPVPDLTAEDLTRGYVMDVLDSLDNTWRSTAEWLVQYKTTSQTLNGPSAPPFSESATQAPPRVQGSPTDPSQQQANVSEVILHYNGWSNAVPRPGTVLPDADSQVTGPIPFPTLTINLSLAPARLPLLRFGHTYMMRARVIDIANNVLPVTATSSGVQQTSPMVFGRQETIGAPDLYSQSVPVLSESLKRLVIRDIDGPSASSLRAIASQRCQEPFAEWHALFDSGGALDPSSFGSSSKTIYNEIVGRESAHYPDPPAPGSAMTTPPQPIALTTPVPFLPDPLARGAALTVTDGTLGGQTFNLDLQAGNTWPDYLPYGLKLVASSTPPNAAQQQATNDTTNRVLTFSLTEADTITVNLVSTCLPADIGNFGLGTVWSGIDANTAAAGGYWSITPNLQIELIYAVQKPLLTPEFPFLAPARGIGDTFAEIEGDLNWSPKSTSNIKVLASWGDPVDDPIHKTVPLQGPGAPDPNLRQTSNSPVLTMPSSTTPLGRSGTQDYSATDRFAARHEFFDTKHRNVTYQAVATSQFTAFYNPGTAVTVDTQHPVALNIPSTARPDTATIDHVVPSYGWQLHHSGKTTSSERSPSALRVYIRRPWWSSGIDELLGVLTWPDAEDRFFGIPPGRIVVAGDERKHHGKRDRRDRRAIAIGRRLGGGAATTAIPGNIGLYVTDWGADPVFQSQPLPSLHPQMSSFPNAVQYGTNLSIEEHADVAVNVAGHPVTFDPTTNLWFADIAVNTGGAYTPMIRLALARFQPNSLAGVELSRVVLADIISLEPGRTATVVRRSANHLSSVTLNGVSYSRGADARDVAPGAAELIIERRQKGVKDPTLGWNQVGEALKMNPSRGPGGTTNWIARNISLPGGELRLVVNQYEVLPTDNREPVSGYFFLLVPARELRLVHQDVIPL